MNPPKPETETVFHTAFFLLMTTVAGVAVWHGAAWWATFSFVGALASLALLIVAANEVEVDEDDPMGE